MQDTIKSYGSKVHILLLWVAAVGGVWFYTRQTGLTALEMVQAIIRFASDSVWGLVVYVIAYAIRPLTLFPSVLLSVAAGIIFGPLWGTILAVLGSNASASIGFFLGYFIGKDILNLKNTNHPFNTYIDRMRQNSFETILTMRLLFLPYDTVGIFAGAMRIRWLPFALATVLGGFAGTLSFVLFGASIEGEFIGQTPEFQPWTLLLAVTLFAFSLLLSRFIRHLSR